MDTNNIIDKVLLEWSALLPDGTPDLNNPDKVTVLNTILKEYGVHYINNGLELIIETEKKKDEKEFLEYCQRFIEPGQDVFGLDKLYESVKSKPKMLDIIYGKTPRKKLKSGKQDIDANHYEFFKECMNFVRPTNGHPSEFWFAVIFNGKVKGSVKGTTGIISDVDVGHEGVSLKSYDKLSTVSLGSIDSKSLTKLNEIERLIQFLTRKEINSSKTNNSINEMLDYLFDPEIIKDIDDFIKLAKDSNVKIIRQIYDRLADILKGSSDTKELAKSFCAVYDNLVKQKLSSVSWWGIIEGGKTLYLETSDQLIDSLKSTADHRLPPTFTSFNLFQLRANFNRILKPK